LKILSTFVTKHFSLMRRSTVLTLPLVAFHARGNLGEGKITYTFSANANVLSANFPFSVLPAGGEGWVHFSTLAERYGERIRCFTPPRGNLVNFPFCIPSQNCYL
jgi:hypothetical protein